jgi:hypothetical protein
VIEDRHLVTGTAPGWRRDDRIEFGSAKNYRSTVSANLKAECRQPLRQTDWRSFNDLLLR